MATGMLEPLDPAVEGPDGRPQRWGEIGNGWPVWRCTRCLHTLPATDGGRGVEIHLLTCHHAPTQDEIRMTRSVLRPDALPPQPHPIPPLDPPLPTGRDSLATCGDVEPKPGLAAASQQDRMIFPLDTALLAPGIRGNFTLRPDPPGQALWWCVRCGMPCRQRGPRPPALIGVPLWLAHPEGGSGAGCGTESG